MKYEMTDYRDAGCKQYGDDIFVGLYYATNGNICKDCPYANEQCKHTIEENAMKDSFTPKITGDLTNAQIANKIGISKRQVAKLKDEIYNLSEGEFKYQERIASLTERLNDLKQSSTGKTLSIKELF